MEEKYLPKFQRMQLVIYLCNFIYLFVKYIRKVTFFFVTLDYDAVLLSTLNLIHIFDKINKKNYFLLL